MIEVQNLCKSYGDRLAIDHLNFKVSAGDVVGFLGPNGAGKSTTMKIITGFLAPSTGEVKVCGYDVFENPIEVKKRIGYLPENPPVYLEMTVNDYLNFVADLKKVDSKFKKEFVQSSLKKTQLEAVQNRLIKNLSKGFKQRVGIAQALVSNPEVLILDEPTVGLDPKQVIEVRELIKELKGKHTLIVSTHILSEVQATCNRVIIINQGKIVAYDDIQHIEKLNQSKTSVQIKIRKEINEADLHQINQQFRFKKINSHQIVAEFENQGVNIEESLENLSDLIMQKKWGLIEFTPQSHSLEDVFLKLTYQNQQEAEVQS